MEITESIKEIVKERYAIGTIENWQMVSSNPDIYRFFADGKEFFLKVKQFEYGNNKNRSNILVIMDCLLTKGIKVPCIIKSKEGKTSERYGDYIIELQEWLEAERYNGGSEEFESTIQLLADASMAMKQCEITATDDLYKSSIKYIHNQQISYEMFDYLFNKYIPSEKYLLESMETILQEYKKHAEKEILEKGLQWIHADFNMKNIGFINSQAKVLYDYERIKIGSVAEDTAMCMFEICIKDIQINEIETYIHTFESCISKYEIISYSRETLFYVIGRRMMRHIYRGLERMETGEQIYDGFYDIFLAGLKKLYSYLKTVTCIEEKPVISNNDRELFDLLIDISGDELSDKERFVRYIDDNNRFDQLFKLCCKHKIMSNLYFHVIHNGLTKHLKKYYLILMNNSMSYSLEKRELYYDEFSKINRLFQENELTYACIKGISISKRFYKTENLILRDFNDMDFLVDVQDLGIAEKVLKDYGYRHGFYDYETSEFAPTDRGEIIACRTGSHQIYPFSKPMPSFRYSPINVFKADINFSVFFGGKIKDEVGAKEMLECVEMIEDERGRFPVLNAEYELLQYCYHFYKDTVYSIKGRDLKYVLSNIRDIHMLVEQERVNIERLYEILDKTSVGNNVYDVISYAFCCYGGEKAKRILEDKVAYKAEEKMDFVISKVINTQ